jgi:hypothetical protein
VAAAPVAAAPAAEDSASVATAPVAPAVTSRPGRSRTRWIAALIVTLLVVGTAAGATLMLTADAGNPGVLAWTPADSVAYAEARLDLPGDQQAELAKVLAAFPGFDDQAAFPAKLNEALDLLVGRASKDKMSYQADIAPWFAGQVAVSVGPIPASADAASVRALVLAGTKDAAKAGAWAARVLADAGATTATETWNGVTITTITLPASDAAMAGSHPAWATFGPILALGDVASIKAAIDTKGTAGLPTNAQFKTAEATVPGDRLGFAYADTAAIMKAAQAAGGSGASAMPTMPAFLDQLNVPWGVSVIRAHGGAFVIDGVTPHAAGLGPDKAAESKLPGLVPATTVALIEGHDAGQALERAKTLLGKDPSLADGIKQVDGALSLLGGYGAVVDWMGEAGVAITVADGKPGGGIVVTPTDPAASERLFTQLRGLLAFAGGSGITVSEEPYAGATIVIVHLGDLGALAGQAAGGALKAPADVSIAYAVTKEVVVVGSGADFVKGVLDARGGDSLATSARFSAALATVDKAHGSLIWLDVAAVRGLAEAQIPEAERGKYDTDVKPYLDAFDSVIGTSTPGETLDRATLIIRVNGN